MEHRSLACVLSVLGGLGLVLPKAHAQGELGVTLRLHPDAQLVASALSLSIEELEERLRTEVAELYSVLDIEQYLKQAANTQAILPAGTGMDYASEPSYLFFGFGLSAAVMTDDSAESVTPISAGASLTLLAGYNFARQGLPWLTVAANGMHFPVNVGQLEGRFTNIGVHTQVTAVDAIEPQWWIRWGGLQLTSGFHVSRTRLTLTDTINADTPLSSDVLLDTASVGQLELIQLAANLSFELTTSVTLLKFLTIYGGGGVDIPTGGASASIDLDSVLTGIVAGSSVDAGTAEIRADENIGADRFLPRAIFGTQLNFWLIKLFAQANVSVASRALSITGDFGVSCSSADPSQAKLMATKVALKLCEGRSRSDAYLQLVSPSAGEIVGDRHRGSLPLRMRSSANALFPRLSSSFHAQLAARGASPYRALFTAQPSSYRARPQSR